MYVQRFADDFSGRHPRVEAGERVLKDDLCPLSELGQIVHLVDVLPVEDDAAVGRIAQAQQGLPGRRFATTGFADQPEGFPFLDGKGDAIDGLHALGLAAE